ncbi:MAG: ornithine carbamoyltransferase [Gemmiger sp.]|nr:ornithine carbamoyltransferase [Gemmiger sp.]
MKHLLKLGDLTPAELLHILDVADEWKRLHRAGQDPQDLKGKSIALIFGKNSTRTRTSFEVGIYQMGGLGTYLNAGTELQIARGEPIQDTARVLGRYYDAIVYRTFKQSDLEALAAWSGVPVISGMTDYAHPLQVLADLMTVRAHKGRLAGLKAGFIGDGYNMANSLITGCLAVGMEVTAACPKGYRPAADVLQRAAGAGGRFTLTEDPAAAAAGADVLFTDVWASMGLEREAENRRRDFAGYQISAPLLALAAPGCLVQHPLPAHRGEEITNEAMEAHAAEIFEEAENRLHVEKAVLSVLLAGR